MEQREKFFKSIIECEQYVAAKIYTRKKEFENFFKDVKPDPVQFFGIRKTGSKYILIRDNASIDQVLSCMGMIAVNTDSKNFMKYLHFMCIPVIDSVLTFYLSEELLVRLPHR